MQGMSGSPVYIDGKLAGAVAMAFPFSKDPIAGIRPIEDMLGRRGTAPAPPARSARLGRRLTDRDLTRALPAPEPALAGDARMADIATPVSFGGFTPRHPGALRAATAAARPGAAAGRHRRRAHRAAAWATPPPSSRAP